MTKLAAPSARSLVDRPQRFILPTLWFWNRKENWRHVRWFFGITAPLLVWGVAALNPGIWWAGLIGFGFPLLTLGLFERYLRWAVVRRRALRESREE